eukprot:2597568-Alexandrium_andersonii.AAC.1
MSASLVGSEMCIRDRIKVTHGDAAGRLNAGCGASAASGRHRFLPLAEGSCLLYTSDAADDM